MTRLRLGQLMRRARRWGVLALALSWPTAQASPASELFGLVARSVREDYYGWSTQNFGALVGDYTQKLQAACSAQTDTCPYEVGRSVARDLLQSYADPHTAIKEPEAAQRTREVQQDLAVWRLGIRTVQANSIEQAAGQPDEALLVVSVMAGSPAAQAGLRRFDLITRVSTTESTPEENSLRPLTPAALTQQERQGGTLHLTIKREGQEKVLTVPTARLKARDIPTLNWVGPDRRVALIDLPSFAAADAGKLFLSAVQQAKRAGASALIVDLRYNGGGRLAQCIAAASIFGPVTYNTEFRVGGYTYAGLGGQVANYAQILGAAPSQKVWNGKAAVLIGPDTASCAEVFSFFARQAGVPLVGQPTKGVANSGVLLSDLPDGSMLSVTVLRGYDVAGKPLPAQLLPDVVAPTDLDLLTRTGADATLQAALEQVEK